MAATMQITADPADQGAPAAVRSHGQQSAHKGRLSRSGIIRPRGHPGTFQRIGCAPVARRLMDDLKGQFRIRAVNLFGYGKTPPWRAGKTQSLDDQARLVEAVLPANADEVYLVGHSFGGSVAMKAATRMEGRVAKLVLLETNPFYLLAQSGRVDAFAEAMELRNSSRNLERLVNGRPRLKNSPTTGAAQEPGGRCRWIAASRSLMPSSAGHAVGMRSSDCLAHPRDRGAPASVQPRLGLQGSAGSRSHGPAHPPGPDQSPGRLISRVVSEYDGVIEVGGRRAPQDG
jgi:pimeloyl-ACP methyl ester carboxylesterase